ncbi:MAG: Hpt domain-containing protein [Candidatus Cloacimonetes bacterium]|nr:Hpt domain-containing protein [Candidatus Cloacimonadota bacterium]
MTAPVFNEKTAMERIGDMDFIRELLQDFYDAIDEDMNNLKKLIVTGDVESIRIASHTIKGTGANLSLDAISAVGRQLESAAKENRKDDFGDLYRTLESEVERFKNFADGFLL